MKKWAAFILLLVLPIMAVAKTFRPDFWPILFGYLTVISLSTYITYWHDKRRASSGGWRVPEKILHLLELLGGWPLAFVAQRVLHHKSSKKSYQIVFWLIVLLHQLVALDYLLDWRISGQLFN